MFRRKEEGLFDSQADATQAENNIEHNTHNEQAASASAHQPAAHFGMNNSQNSTAATPATASSQAAGAQSQTAGTQARPASSAPTASSFRPNPVTSATPSAADSNRARMPEAGKTASGSSAIASIAASLEKAKTGKRVLTVGNDILLKGEIATCDRLVIEGQVDATLNDVHTVEISECGSFKGSAQIEDAEIRGLFEGDLTVRGRLVIFSTGKVRGKISFGEIEIERGGELTGEIKLVGAANSAVTAAKSTSSNEAKVAA